MHLSIYFKTSYNWCLLVVETLHNSVPQSYMMKRDFSPGS